MGIGAAQGVAALWGNKIEMTLGTIIIILIVGGIAFSIGMFLVMAFIQGMMLVPIFFCSVVAPNPQVASVIFGTTYILSVGYSVLKSCVDGEWGWLLFNVAASILIMWGTVTAYKVQR